MTSPTWDLIDERTGEADGDATVGVAGPLSLRERIGDLLARAEAADFAVARIRLAGIDLTPGELGGIRRLRVLLGELDASTLADASETGPDPVRRGNLRRLLELARSGRLEVRSAGLAAWMPDFALIRPPGSGPPSTLMGSIYLGTPYLTVGPSFTCVTTSRSAARVAGHRFEELWDHGHDVLPAIVAVLERFVALDD